MATSSWADGAVDETIGSGQDRANIAAFESAHDGESPTDGTTCKGRLIGADANTGVQYWDGWQSGMDDDTYIIIIAEDGCEPDGLNDASGNDALIQARWYFDESTNPFYMDIINLEFDAQENGNFYAIYPTADAGGRLRIAKCVLRDGLANGIIANNVSSAFTIDIGGCLFKDVGTDLYSSAIVNKSSNVTMNVFNCTISNCGTSASGNAGVAAIGSSVDVELKNSALVDNDPDIKASGGGHVNETTNASEDDGDITNNDADDFTAPSIEDFTVYDTDSDLYHQGTQITDSWFTTLCATDFAGTAWNNPPSIGCFEYLIGAGPEEVALTLAAYAGLSHAGGATAGGAMTLAKNLGIQPAGGATAGASLILALQKAISIQAITSAGGSLTLSTNMALSTQGAVTAESTVTFSNQLSIQLAGGAVTGAALLLASQLAVTFQSAGLVVDVDMTLAHAMGLSQAASAVSEADLALLKYLGIASSAQAAAAAAIALAHQQAMTQAGSMIMEGAVDFASILELQQTASVTAEGTLTLAHITALTMVGQTLAEAGLPLSVIKAITLVGQGGLEVDIIGEVDLEALFDLQEDLNALFITNVALDAAFETDINLEGSIDMTEINQDFTMYAGEKKVLVFTDTGGKVLTGASITWRMSTYNDRSTTLVEKSVGSGIQITDTSEFKVTLDSADTLTLAEDRYWHEAAVTDNQGDPAVVAVGTIFINDQLEAKP